jgi:formylglycine-generating enzyme required for sulfatase activity
MSEENIRLTVVQLDLFQSSKSTNFIEDELGVEGTKLFVKQIREFVEKAFKPIKDNSPYNEMYSLGGDGYRISFINVNDAYQFVKYFCIEVNQNNIIRDNKRLFRIGAATGNVLYDESQSGIDKIIGHRVLFTVSRMVTAAEPGWLYVDEATYKALSQDLKNEFIYRNVTVKKHENIFHAYACSMLSDAFPFMKPFNFKIATIDEKNNIKYQDKEIKEIKIEAKYFSEKLPNNNNKINLEMVSIPDGTFQMGTADDEIERLCKQSEVDYFRREKPQHRVTVKSFYLGKYPVTQAQWKAVASLPTREKELNADPSHFKGENRPVECVSWSDAVEFCLRLSHHTKRHYRLPSEAEWEYACRGGTTTPTTPFHFGETITTDLANYDGNYIFGHGVKGIYRRETTEVGSFKVANNFGLYDMHGNVWEWCQDHWHNSYEYAPTDGSAWQDTDISNYRRLLRGGSWGSFPEHCRSAYRLDCYLDTDYGDFGFRVVCSGAART